MSNCLLSSGSLVRIQSGVPKCSVNRGDTLGNPEYCYKEMMKNYIMFSTGFSKSLAERFSPENLKDKSIEELECIVKQFNRSHTSYSHFVAGLAVNQFMNDWDENTDMLNAACGGITDMLELVGVYEPDDTDFQDTE